MRPASRWLGPTRLHLQHGPIDLIIGADGGSGLAFAAAEARFATVLAELVSELDLLRQHGGAKPKGYVAQIMHGAAQPHMPDTFVTPMAAVAGSVAQTILGAMVAAEPALLRAYVNNGGDIALHLAQGETYRAAIADHYGVEMGRVAIRAGDRIAGIATSARHGRSLSLGIADSVTVLADSAAQADICATLIANAVDLPGHPSIRRHPASQVRDDSDLAERPVVVGVGRLSDQEKQQALSAGLDQARDFLSAGHIKAAALFLQSECLALGCAEHLNSKGSLAHV